MALRTDSLRRRVVNSVNQPLYIGGVANDNSDPKITISAAGVVDLADGTTMSGTPLAKTTTTLRSITDRGTGLYTVNFTTAMIDANYACVQSSGDNNILAVTAQYAGYVEIKNTHPNEMIVDTAYANVSILR